MTTKLLIYSMLACGCLTISCTQNEDLTLTSAFSPQTGDAGITRPAVTCNVTDIRAKSATLKAVIDNPGTAPVKQRGFVYSITNTNPKVNDPTGTLRRISTEQTSAFSYTLTGLETDILTHARSYIIYNTRDTAYSEVISFIPVRRLPKVETMEVVNRVKRAAIVCGRFVAGGDDLSEYGIALSRTSAPKPGTDTYIAAPDTASDAGYKGIFGVFFDNLEAHTLYHARAYCIFRNTNGPDTIYGKERIFRTTDGGRFTWSWSNKEGAVAAGADRRITEAVDSAMYYYRNYTNLSKHLYVNYSPGTPTADCNIEGWMNMGAVARYQWVGTVQHEMCHGLGVGTARNWGNFGSPWTGYQANLVLRVMMRDMSMKIYKDGMHFWPGGINQQEEVTQGTSNDKKTYKLHNAEMLKANAMIINAMRTDGLYSY